MTRLSSRHCQLLLAAALALVLPPLPATARVSQPAGMAADAGNAALPNALNNLGVAKVYTPYQFGGVGDTQRATCTVTMTAASTDLSVSGCAPFAAGDVGKILVVNNAGASATTPLVTTIAAYISSSHVTMGNAAGQTLAGVSEPVTFGHDDSAAINACLSASVAAGATQSYCYLPPAAGGYWGAASAIELFPNSLNTMFVGAGRDRSQVVALAAMPYLVHRGSTFLRGGVMRDIGFDGAKLVTDVGYLSCASFRHDQNVGFYNAGTDSGAVYGDAAGNTAGCNTAQITDVRTYNDPAFYPGNDFPNYGLIVNSTDNKISGVSCVDTLTAGIWIDTAGFDTELRGGHCWGSAGAGGTGLLISSVKQRVYGMVCDTPIATCIDVEAGDVNIVGGLDTNTTGTGINVALSTNDVDIVGFDANTIATQANRVLLNTPHGARLCVQGNPGAIDQCYVYGGFNVLGSDGSWQFAASNTASAANYIAALANVAGQAPYFECIGSDTNISCRLLAKGNGTILFGSHEQDLDTAALAPTSCGSSPSVSGTDNARIITVGTGTVTACTLPFGQTWASAPKCVVAGIGTGSAIVSLSAAPTTASFIIAASASIGGLKVAYRCVQ
ncbi:MAG TPA: hypothetical protein VNF04_02990 [Stellaceae bacterium]|nr:hypothetical protein [Stellaceae bacterium]